MRDINQKGENVPIIMSRYKSYFKNHRTYVANFVLKMTGNYKFIFNLYRNKRSKINSFQVIAD